MTNENEEYDATDVDWQETAKTLQAEVTRLQKAAKAEPLNVDREALVELAAKVSAVSRYEYVNFGKHWDDLNGREQEEWVRSERRLIPTVLDAVLKNLSAQEAATEVEYVDWGVRIGTWPPARVQTREVAEYSVAHPVPNEKQYPHVVVFRTTRHTAWEEAK